MSDLKRYLGFWPWPRVWTTESAADLASTVRVGGGVSLTRALTAAEAITFRQVAVEYAQGGFDAQLCADGLIAYREDALEQAISADWERAKVDITAGMPASSAAWERYISALGIMFLLVESELHLHGRGNQIYWVEPVGRSSTYRPGYASDGSLARNGYYGPITEMGLVREVGAKAIGARIDGTYQPDVVGAFNDAMPMLARAFADPPLWAFLDVHSNAWTTYKLGHFDASVMMAWSLIERDLVRRAQAIATATPVGGLMRHRPHDHGPNPMPANQENALRATLAAGESPMAGRLLGLLRGHGEAINNDLLAAKDARDRLAHGGASATPAEAVAGLRAVAAIAADHFGVQLNPSLHPNAHLGLTP